MVCLTACRITNDVSQPAQSVAIKKTSVRADDKPFGLVGHGPEVVIAQEICATCPITHDPDLVHFASLETFFTIFPRDLRVEDRFEVGWLCKQSHVRPIFLQVGVQLIVPSDVREGFKKEKTGRCPSNRQNLLWLLVDYLAFDAMSSAGAIRIASTFTRRRV